MNVAKHLLPMYTLVCSAGQTAAAEPLRPWTVLRATPVSPLILEKPRQLLWFRLETLASF